MSYQIIKRTFEARKYPQGSVERANLNGSALTSEYFTSFPYILRRPFFMSDGSLHHQLWMDDEYKTKKEARETARVQGYGNEVTFELIEGVLIEHKI